ncbi:sulfatase-like hydrolase/transferase [Bremerella sp. T1]|uniref:sulfatase-like hydrolase/transferase n=1 Tax=Bremerella sp. TYQ1 TaxID=3119568 RepID=UPI001CCA4FA3|nr:sulfatase-like hydrolase/transferase [Bremerella volcania]UBM34017.1 sulfatase-like hydrolase/transferase [Bremerella volcania]
MRRALVLVVDGWGAGFLGCYGNSWLDTPALDHWACQSVLFEQCVSECPDPLTLYPHLFGGSHPVGAIQPGGLMSALADAEIPVHLLSDDPRLAELRDTTPLASVETFPEVAEVAASSPEETTLARFASVLLDWLEEPAREEVIWAHARGMLGPWDAPYSFRQDLADEEDPAPPEIVQPPFERENREFDSDHILGITQAYAGQVTVLDMLLGELLATIEELPEEEQPLVVLTSTGGYPLGLHGQIGRDDESTVRLYSDTLHVPLMIRQPGAKEGLTRCQGIARLGDILPTIVETFGLQNASEEGLNLLTVRLGESREFVLSGFADQRCFRSKHWSLRYHLPDLETPLEEIDTFQIATELFVKPDDRWEVNNVADRCKNIAEVGLNTALAIEKAYRDGSPLPEIPDELKEAV